MDGMKGRFPMTTLALFLIAVPVQSKSFIDVGETGDTSYGDGMVFLDSQSNWGLPTTVNGESVRYTNPETVANDACGFKFTLPSEDAVICVSTYDDTNDDVLLYVDYWNGDTWQDYLLGSISFRNRERHHDNFFFLPRSVIDSASDSDATQPGKQVAFKFWDSDGGWLSASFAVDRIHLLNGTRNPFLPDGTPVKAIKFDPWVSAQVYGSDMDPEFIVRRYYSMGFNTVFLIAQFSTNEVCFDTQATPFIYRNFGEDFLPRLVQACEKYGIQLCAGMWGMRNTPVVEAHPDWGMKNSSNVQQINQVCTASPYMDQYVIPMFQELHDVYGIKHFFSQEFWIEGHVSYSDYMIDGFNTEYGYSYSRSALASAGGTVNTQWYNYNKMSQMRMIQAIHKIMDDDGIFVWHNVAGIDWKWDVSHTTRVDFNWVRNFPTLNSFGSPYADYLGNMILYVDVMYFEGLCPWEGMPATQPVELWPGYDRMVHPVGIMPSEYLICETVGRSVQNRPHDREETENIYLSDFIAAHSDVGFIYEQDAHGFEDADMTVPKGLTNWNRDWWPLLIDVPEINTSSFVSYTETNRRKAKAYQLPTAFGNSNVRAALLANMDNSAAEFTLLPSARKVLYDVKANAILASNIITVPSQDVMFVAELSSNYDATRPYVTQVTGLNRLTVSFSEPMKASSVENANNFYITPDDNYNLEYLRTLDVGEATDTVIPMDGVNGSWGARTTTSGRSVRYTITGDGNASTCFITVDPDTNYAVEIVYFNNSSLTTARLYLDYWDGGSWKDCPVAVLAFDESNTWKTARGFIPAEAIASAADPLRDSGKQIALRFWGASSWLENSFAVDRMDIYRNNIPAIPKVTVDAASIHPTDGSIVVLDVSGIQSGVNYTLELVNTQDQAGNFTPWQSTFEFLADENAVISGWQLY